MLFFATLISIFAVFLFINRVIFPDTAYDTINYHFFIGKASFDNFPNMFKPTEFFPVGMHSFNPLMDSINFLIYKAVGYRLGTILSLLALISALFLVIRIVRKVVGSSISLLATCLLLPTLIVNEVFFAIATYYTDTMNAFLILCYLYILIDIEEYKNNLISFLLRTLTLGVISALLLVKLVNCIYLIPLFLTTLYLGFKVFRPQNNNQPKYLPLIAALLFIIPIIVLPGYYFYTVFEKTGNPLFPYYNAIFHSPFYPFKSWLFNFGPTSLMQRIFYPYFAIRDPHILGECQEALPNLKLITTLLFSCIGIIFILFKKITIHEKERILLFITFSSYVLWQVFFGYNRYGIALEFLLGLSVMILVNKILLPAKNNYLLKCLILFYFIFTLYQSIAIIKHTKYEASGRTHLIYESIATTIKHAKHKGTDIPSLSYAQWKKQFFSKKTFAKYTSYDAKIADKLKHADVVIQCINSSAGYFLTLPDLMNKPMMCFDRGWNYDLTSNKNYTTTRDSLISNFFQKKLVNFAIVLNDNDIKKHNIVTGCFKALNENKAMGYIFDIQDTLIIDNFIGDFTQKLTVILGKLHLP